MKLIVEYIKRCLEKLGYSVPTASSGEEAIKSYRDFSKLVIMDIRLKGDGVQAAETI